MTAWMMSARLWYVLLEITIALIGALKVYLLCNLGNYERPTNQQTDLRVHREVTLQITIILWFKKKCIFIISDRILSIVIIPLIFRQQIFSQKRINFCWEPYLSFYAFVNMAREFGNNRNMFIMKDLFSVIFRIQSFIIDRGFCKHINCDKILSLRIMFLIYAYW